MKSGESKLWFHIHCMPQFKLKFSIKIIKIDIICTVGQKNIYIYFNANYRTEMKLVPVIMDYCLLRFEAFKFFVGLRLHGGFSPNFIFF